MIVVLGDELALNMGLSVDKDIRAGECEICKNKPALCLDWAGNTSFQFHNVLARSYPSPPVIICQECSDLINKLLARWFTHIDSSLEKYPESRRFFYIRVNDLFYRLRDFIIDQLQKNNYNILYI